MKNNQSNVEYNNDSSKVIKMRKGNQDFKSEKGEGLAAH